VFERGTGQLAESVATRILIPVHEGGSSFRLSFCRLLDSINMLDVSVFEEKQIDIGFLGEARPEA
jgi:hypothetical protein